MKQLSLKLGVTDVPYSFSANFGKTSSGKSRVATTGEVAEILEAKYHVMEVFWEFHQKEIAALLEEALLGSLETAIDSGSFPTNPYASAMPEIEAMFNTFLDSREMDSAGYSGVPTKAALKGINHRLAHPYAKNNPERPSFVDSATYENSFRAWVD